MRNKKLLISSVIAFVGIIIYFLTIPMIDEEALVNLNVKAGDKDVLEDIYFNGHLSDYSSFTIDEDGVETIKGMSYLEQQDAASNQTLAQLQREYPDFISHIIYNYQAWEYNIVNSPEYLASSYFKYDMSNGRYDMSNLYLEVYHKETDTTEEAVIKREAYPEGTRVETLGLYEEYPVIKMLIHTDVFKDGHIRQDTSILSIGEYNVETDTYRERKLLDEEGDFFPYFRHPSVSSNHEIQIVEHSQYENNNYDLGEQSFYVFNFKDNSITLLDIQDAYPLIDNANQLYTLENVEGETSLKHYNQKGDELLSEVALDLQIPISPESEYPILNARIFNDKLYLAQSTIATYSDLVADGAAPTPLQVLDIKTGASLLVGEFEFNTKNEVEIYEGTIEEIGLKND